MCQFVSVRVDAGEADTEVGGGTRKWRVEHAAGGIKCGPGESIKHAESERRPKVYLVVSRRREVRDNRIRD